MLADKVQFGVVDFADEARIVVPLGDFSGADLETHQLSVRGGTHYGNAFTTMRQTIDNDITAGARQYRYFRPAVFFLTDGCPTDSRWAEAFRELTHYDAATGQGFRSYPLFVLFGIGAADRAILSRLVHPTERSTLFMADDDTRPATAIERMTSAMLKSIVASGRSVLIGKPQHVVPTAQTSAPA